MGFMTVFSMSLFRYDIYDNKLRSVKDTGLYIFGKTSADDHGFSSEVIASPRVFREPALMRRIKTV